MVKDVLIKTAEQRILSLFATNPDRAFYGREISSKTGISLGATSNALRLLERKGLLTFERKGKTNLYALKLPNPYIKHFKILNSLLIMEPLIEKLKSVSKRIILYGSYATGSFTSDSDLDLFIVSNKRKEVLERLENFKGSIDIEINPVIKKQIGWMKLETSDPEFFDQLSGGITLWEKPINESGF